MQLTNTFLVALLPALSVATSYRKPGSQSPIGGSLKGNTNAGAAPGINDCGVSSFIGLTQAPENNADVTDCQKMLDTIRSDKEWPVTASDSIIVSYGTCAFGVKLSSGAAPGVTGAIGNADVIDLVTDSIKKYATKGKVGCHGGYKMVVSSAGAMPCDSPDLPKGQQIGVDWTLTHS